MKRILAIAAALMLSACATFGVDKPQGFKQNLTYAEAQYHAAVDAIDSSLNAGEIGSAMAESLVKKADAANALLVDAKTAYVLACGSRDNDPTCTDPTAQDKLSLALVSLTALQAFLREQHPKTTLVPVDHSSYIVGRIMAPVGEVR